MKIDFDQFLSAAQLQALGKVREQLVAQATRELQNARDSTSPSSNSTAKTLSEA
jgi:hypothetical protein